MILSDKAKIDHYVDQGVWGSNTLDALFRKCVRTQPDDLALVDAPNRTQFTVNEPKRLDYKALNHAVERLAGTFIGLGLKRDDVVAVQMPNVVEQIVVVLAGMRAGLIISPLPIMWREHELKTALPLIAPRAIITMSAHNFDHVDMMRNVALHITTVRFVLAFGEDLPDGVMPLDEIFTESTDQLPEVDEELANKLNANDVAIITWAGGDCAGPCPLPRSHNQLIAAGLMPMLEAGLAGGSIILSPYLLNGLVAFSVFFMPWLLSGGKLVLHHPFDIDVFAAQMREEQVNFTGLPPSVIDVIRSENIFDPANDDTNLDAIACIWPAPILPQNAETRAAGLDVPVIDIRNLNEMVVVARKRQTGARPALIPHGAFGVPYGGEQGPILINTRVKGSVSLNDTSESLLGGDLLIESPMMFDDYFPAAIDNAPQPALVKEKQNYINTGHRCMLTGGTDAMIEILAQDNNTIVHGGLWISAAELDQLYAQYDQFSDAAAFSFADPVMGERIMAAVVPSPGVDIKLSDLTAYLEQQKVAAYKMPDRLVTVKAIPRGANGEVLRDQVLEEI